MTDLLILFMFRSSLFLVPVLLVVSSSDTHAPSAAFLTHQKKNTIGILHHCRRRRRRHQSFLGGDRRGQAQKALAHTNRPFHSQGIVQLRSITLIVGAACDSFSFVSSYKLICVSNSRPKTYFIRSELRKLHILP